MNLKIDPMFGFFQVNGMIHIHLPDGPTATYRISNLKLGRDIKVSEGL
jgi:hypothetical protein